MRNEKKNPFKKVTEQLPFYPDLTKTEQEPFYCSLVGETELGDDPDEKKRIPVFILADANTGEEVFCVQSYAVKKTIEAARKEHKDLTNVVFCFQFLGKTEVKGKPFNKFNGSYCTLDEYTNYVKEPDVKPEKAKK
jgi:hypothetical protein